MCIRPFFFRIVKNNDSNIYLHKKYLQYYCILYYMLHTLFIGTSKSINFIRDSIFINLRNKQLYNVTLPIYFVILVIGGEINPLLIFERQPVYKIH